jgi:hypothetical protein
MMRLYRNARDRNGQRFRSRYAMRRGRLLCHSVACSQACAKREHRCFAFLDRSRPLPSKWLLAGKETPLKHRGTKELESSVPGARLDVWLPFVGNYRTFLMTSGVPASDEFFDLCPFVLLR